MRSKINMQAIYAKTYQEYQHYYQKAGKDMPNPFLLSRSAMIMTAPITTGMSVANFYSTQNSGGPAIQNWETRLAITDTFTIARLGVQLYGNVGTSTGPAGSLAGRFWSYSPTELAKTFVTLEPIYDGNTTLNMILNSAQYFKNWQVGQHREVTRTQMIPFEAITTSGSPGAARQSSIVQGDAGMLDCEPTIRVQGNWNNNITINIGNPQGIAPVTNFAYLSSNNDTEYININYINLVFEGLLAQNVTAVLG